MRDVLRLTENLELHGVVLALWRQGYDTYAIAKKLNERESRIYTVLHIALEEGKCRFPTTSISRPTETRGSRD